MNKNLPSTVSLKYRILPLFFLLLIFVNDIFSQQYPDSTANPPVAIKGRRPKIGLVLSGGGAKGLAHIGVLKYLEKAGIRPDYITGTSMGSIIGGLYAIGYSADELDSMIRHINWTITLSDKTYLYDVEPLEKNNYERFAVEFNLEKSGLKLPNGLVKGQNISELLSQYTWRVAGIKNFDDFPIPFRCVASDLITGKQHVFKSGDLMTALRASMAIPSVFTPVKVDTMFLVDGGALNNFPVNVCREMGAEIIIGVNVSTGDYPKIKDLNSIIKVLMTAAMLGNTPEMIKAVKNTDLLITPKLYPYTTSSFGDAGQIIKRGEEAGEKYYPRIKALADSLNRLGPPPEIKKLTNPEKIYIKKIILHDLVKLSENFILTNLQIHDGDTVTVKEVNKGLGELIGTRFVDKATYKLSKLDDGYLMDLYITERNPFKMGFSLQYDNVFGVGLVANITARNVFLKNTRTSFTVDISANPRIDADFYETFGKDRKSAVVFNGSFEKTIWPIYLDNGHRYGMFNFFQPGVGLGYAYSFNTKSILYAGTSWKKITLHSGTGINEIFDNGVNSFGNGFYSADFMYDYNSFDKRYFVTRGSNLRINVSFNIHAYEIYDGIPESHELVEEAILIPDKNYFKFGIKYNHYFYLNKNMVLNASITGNIITHEVPYLDHIFIGGTILNSRKLDIPFYGLDYRERIGEDFVTFALKYRVQLGKLFNIYLITNGLYNGEYERSEFEKLPQTFIGNEFLFGYGAAIGMNSFIGPIGVGAASNLTDNRWRWYINVGLPF